MILATALQPRSVHKGIRYSSPATGECVSCKTTAGRKGHCDQMHAPKSRKAVCLCQNATANRSHENMELYSQPQARPKVACPQTERGRPGPADACAGLCSPFGPQRHTQSATRSRHASLCTVSGKHPPPVACRSFRHFEPSLQSPLHISISLLVSYRSHVCMQPCHGHAWRFDLQSQAARLRGLAYVHNMARTPASALDRRAVAQVLRTIPGHSDSGPVP